MRHVLRGRRLFAVFVVFLCVIAIYCAYVSLGGLSQEERHYADGEIDWINPVSNCGGYAIVTDAIPIAMLQLFNDNLSVMEKLDLYEELEELTLPVNYGMELESENEAGYSVIELEYYDPLTKSYYYPMDLYREICGLDADAEIDTSAYFYVDEISGEEGGTPLDLDKYYECRDTILQEYEGAGLECTYMVVLLPKGMTFLDFISLPEVENLANGNFYLRSQETGEMLIQMKTLQSQVRSVSQSLILSVLCLMIYLMVVGITLHLEKNHLISFQNMNVDRKQVVSVLREKMGMDNLSMGMTILAIISIFIIFWERNVSGHVGNYLSTFVMIGTFILMNRICRIMISLYTKYIWGWKRR